MERYFSSKVKPKKGVFDDGKPEKNLTKINKNYLASKWWQEKLGMMGKLQACLNIIQVYLSGSELDFQN